MDDWRELTEDYLDGAARVRPPGGQASSQGRNQYSVSGKPCSHQANPPVMTLMMRCVEGHTVSLIINVACVLRIIQLRIALHMAVQVQAGRTVVDYLW